MADRSYEVWFQRPQPTEEAAKAQYEYELFNPAATFRTPDGQYVLGLLLEREWSREFVVEAAREIKRLLDYDMISYCSPIVPVWRSVDKLKSDS